MKPYSVCLNEGSGLLKLGSFLIQVHGTAPLLQQASACTDYQVGPVGYQKAPRYTNKCGLLCNSLREFVSFGASAGGCLTEGVIDRV